MNHGYAINHLGVIYRYEGRATRTNNTWRTWVAECSLIDDSDGDGRFNARIVAETVAAPAAVDNAVNDQQPRQGLIAALRQRGWQPLPLQRMLYDKKAASFVIALNPPLVEHTQHPNDDALRQRIGARTSGATAITTVQLSHARHHAPPACTDDPTVLAHALANTNARLTRLGSLNDAGRVGYAARVHPCVRQHQ